LRRYTVAKQRPPGLSLLLLLLIRGHSLLAFGIRGHPSRGRRGRRRVGDRTEICRLSLRPTVAAEVHQTRHRLGVGEIYLQVLLQATGARGHQQESAEEEQHEKGDIERDD